MSSQPFKYNLIIRFWVKEKEGKKDGEALVPPGLPTCGNSSLLDF